MREEKNAQFKEGGEGIKGFFIILFWEVKLLQEFNRFSRKC